MTAVVIHGHFYQPPRENPWTGLLDRETSAAPYHDWNQRIHHECYRPNAFARILDEYGRVERIVNNYAYMNFNFGPSLLSWMETYDPTTYARILAADRLSAEQHGGHGNAIAQAYNHVILPLCHARDRITQVRWGLRDFRHRFGRDAESLWLPETACSDAVLGTLIDEGLRYVILSPYQAERVRPLGGDETTWRSVEKGIDPTSPYRYFHRDGSGRSIAIFFYDGPLARAVAFEGALVSSQVLVERLLTAAEAGPLVHVATDGETYGHHHRFGDRTLAYALLVEAQRQGLEITNYGAYLEQYPPTEEVEIKPGPGGEGTAWSCFHGVGRWYRDCGCRTGAQDGWNQVWRGPVRQALDLLRDEAARCFAETEGELFADPWAARDDYIQLLLEPERPREAWLRHHVVRLRGEQDQVRALTHLELQRQVLRMYTSCGWFFADLSGIETVQILKYAGRAMDLMEDLELDSPREAVLELLAEARSNLPQWGSGADIFRRVVDPLRVTPKRIAAHLALSGLVEEGAEAGEIANVQFRRSGYQCQRHGRLTLSTVRLQLRAQATERRYDFAAAAIHFGGVDIYCVVRDCPGRHEFRTASAKLWRDFRTRSLPVLLRVAQDEFGPDEFGLDGILPPGRERISQMVLGDVMRDFLPQRHFFETNQRILDMLQEAGFELPQEVLAAVQFTLRRRLEEAIDEARGSHDPAAYQRALDVAKDADGHGYQLDLRSISQSMGERVAESVAAALVELDPLKLRSAAGLVGVAHRLRADQHLHRAQELVYEHFSVRASWSEEARGLALALHFSPGFAGYAEDELLATEATAPALGEAAAGPSN
ncbi:MAG TPA: DUF3536 domain-containing protein [Polyangia bacterium]|jgi:alpha-amylase/alpha-mannosidase (GH57 family)|nr:DUF3536 domain-containing protein [Polyangia bacterium]